MRQCIIGDCEEERMDGSIYCVGHQLQAEMQAQGLDEEPCDVMVLVEECEDARRIEALCYGLAGAAATAWLAVLAMSLLR